MTSNRSGYTRGCVGSVLLLQKASRSQHGGKGDLSAGNHVTDDDSGRLDPLFHVVRRRVHPMCPSVLACTGIKRDGSSKAPEMLPTFKLLIVAPSLPHHMRLAITRVDCVQALVHSAVRKP